MTGGNARRGHYNAPMRNPLSAMTPERVAVWLPSWVGDAVMAAPSLRALRERFARATITLIGRPAPLEVLAGGDLADAALPDAPGQLLALLRAGKALRRERFDLAVLLPNSFRSALVARLARIPRRLGYARDGRSWLLTDRLAPPKDAGGYRVVPARDYYADLVEVTGAKVTDRTLRLAVSDAGRQQADALLAEAEWDASRPTVMLNPGGGFGPSKRWPAERFAAAADALADRHAAQIIINAAPGETDVAAQVAIAMKRDVLVNLADRANSLALLKALLARCNVLITNDTGARHVAAGVGAGIVSIFGSTDPAWTTLDYDLERIIQAEVPCAPCQKKACPNPPGETFHQCMTSIEVDDVAAAASELLSAADASKRGDG